MPCTVAARRASSLALASAVVALAVVLTCLAPAARGADTVSRATPDTSVRITTSPPAIQVDTTTQAKKDETTDETGTTATKRGKAHVTIDSDDEDFDAFSGAVRKNPWIIGLVFLVVGSIFLTPVILLIGIIWYKLRKARLQNEAMLGLPKRVSFLRRRPPTRLSAGASPASVAPQIYQQAVALRKRVIWSDLRKGVILSMLGAAFCLLLDRRASGEPSWVGLILLFVGIAYIALWWLEGRHLDQARCGPYRQRHPGAAENAAAAVPGSGGPESLRRQRSMSVPAVSDAQLIARVLVQDDRHAFGELVRRHQSTVRACLRKLTAGNAALADDLAQETFLLAYRNLKSFRQEAKFSTWLYRIAYNVFLADARKMKEAPLSDDADLDELSAEQHEEQSAGRPRGNAQDRS